MRIYKPSAIIHDQKIRGDSHAQALFSGPPAVSTGEFNS